ncbi:MAG: DNRLRE domain-containing protein, partial [Chloroflexi bacterium]|nr:DNRLRE domain-containing protein [Chloroflexota bacterium]
MGSPSPFKTATGAFVALTALLIGAFIHLSPSSAAFSAARATLTFYATGDARISEGYPDVNYDGQHLVAGYATIYKREHSLVQFDLSSLPEPVNITQAIVRVRVNDVWGAGPQELRVRHVTEAWDESAVTWSSQPASVATGQSAAVASTGWVSWDVTQALSFWAEKRDVPFSIKIVGPVNVQFLAYIDAKETGSAAELIVSYEIPPTNTPLPTFTPTPTFTSLPTFTPPPSFTPPPTFTPTATRTPLPTFTPPPGQTPSPTPTNSNQPPPPTFTPTPTAAAGLKHVRDLGDAPDSSNGVGLAMFAYPGVPAQFPTVFSAGSPPHGPIHLNAKLAFILGDSITAEEEADAGADDDGLHNIDPIAGRSDQDGGDDGLHATMSDFPHCVATTVQFSVLAFAGAPANAYINIWADWDRNGRWGDAPSCGATLASEWAVQNQRIALSGPGYYTFTSTTFLPYNPDPTKDIWVRITLTDQPLPVPQAANAAGPPTGFQLGETEDYLIKGIWPTLTPTPSHTPTPTWTP